MKTELMTLMSLIVSILGLIVTVLSLLRDFFNWGPQSWKKEYSQWIRRVAFAFLGVGVVAYAILQHVQSTQGAHAAAQAQAQQTAQVATIAVLEESSRSQGTALAEARATQTRQVATATALEETYLRRSTELAQARATLTAPRTAPVALAADQLVAPESFDAGSPKWKLDIGWRAENENENGYLCAKSAEGQSTYATPEESPDVVRWSVTSDYVFEVDVKPISFSTKGICGILLRKSDPKSVFYALHLKPTGVAIYECAGDSCNNQLWEAKSSIASGAWHTIFVQAEGAEILVLLDGRQALRERTENKNPYSGMPQPRGIAWLDVGFGAECCFDNIRVLKVQR
ncbi:MAG: hypothetical protein NT169_24995 [Chloroflexi bacterium]|nr:hypothetical protein [Chloroflexota bacterium]